MRVIVPINKFITRSISPSLTIVLLCCICFFNLTYSQTAETNRPKVGLVLSGGGARGLAHVGVIKVIEEAGIPIDMITGTSMGALVGGLYAAGYDAAAIDKIVREQNWNELLADQISRGEISMSEKYDRQRYSGSFPIYGREVSLPAGVLAGQNVSMLLSNLTWHVHHVDDFNNFPIPFACKAVDMETGEAVTLNSGFLPEAMRASMAIPSVFTPVEIDNRLLVDGGIVVNFPVEDARRMGADIIIGVYVGQKLCPKEDLHSLTDIMIQALNFQGIKDAEKQKPFCDIYIEPDIDDYSIADFHKADSLVMAGERTARKQLETLKALSDSLFPHYKAKHKFIPTRAISEIYVTEIKVRGLKKTSKDLVLGKIQLDTPSRVTVDQLEQSIRQVYGSQFYESVNYQFTPNSNGTTLIVKVKETTTNKINFGFNYSSEHNIGVLLNATMRNLIGHGSKLSVETVLGDNVGFGARYNYYTNQWPALGIGLSQKVWRYGRKIYSDYERVAEYRYTDNLTTLHIQPIVMNQVLLELNAQYQHTRNSPRIVPPTWNQHVEQSDYFNVIGLFKLDSFDNAAFPTRGNYLRTEVRYMTPLSDDAVAMEPFYKVSATWAGARSLSKLALHYSVTGGYLSTNKVPMDQLFYVGGDHVYENSMFPFVGLGYMEIQASNILLGRLAMQYRFYKSHFVTAHLNTVQAQYRFKDALTTDGWVWGYGLTYGLKTPIGPIKFTAASNNETHDLQTYLSMGYWF